MPPHQCSSSHTYMFGPCQLCYDQPNMISTLPMPTNQQQYPNMSNMSSPAATPPTPNHHSLFTVLTPSAQTDQPFGV